MAEFTEYTIIMVISYNPSIREYHSSLLNWYQDLEYNSNYFENAAMIHGLSLWLIGSKPVSHQAGRTGSDHPIGQPIPLDHPRVLVIALKCQFLIERLAEFLDFFSYVDMAREYKTGKAKIWQTGR